MPAQAFTIGLASGSTQGKGVLVAATASPGTTIHTAVAGTTSLDLITILATNNHTAAVEVTIQWGGTTSPDNDIKQTIQPKSGLVPIVVNMPLQNSLVVKAWAGTTNVVVLYADVKQAV